MCGYSFATTEMSFDRDTYIGYVEVSLGVGDMIGPALAGFAYEVYGFEGTFLVFACLILLGLIFSLLMIPTFFNERLCDIDTEEEEHEETQGLD